MRWRNGCKISILAISEYFFTVLAAGLAGRRVSLPRLFNRTMCDDHGGRRGPTATSVEATVDSESLYSGRWS